MRVYELARELGVQGRDILLLLEELGVGGRTASSRVPPEYLDVIRVRLGRAAKAEGAAEPEAPAPPKPAPAPTRERKKRPAAPARAPVEAEAEPAAKAPPEGEAAPESEEAASTISLKPPVTVAAFATALDTDADNVISAAAAIGETVGEGDQIAAELAALIGEQWGYTVTIEEPEGAQAPPAPAPEPEEVEAEVPEAEETAEPAEVKVTPKAAEPPVAPRRVVPRRVSDPGAPLRPPVVTVLGHVDHGKTTLLDAIRETNVAAGEAGAITQHIGAYQVEVNGRPITFIDTPGHEAFTAMRARGAQVTDIAVLVVAADDGVMPQTLEAVDHAQAAGVPIIVAINKIDRGASGVETVKQRLAAKGLVPEEWGGDTVYAPVSALQKVGVEDLLDMILLVADLRDLRARQEGPAEGVVLEGELDRRRGCVATFLVQEGTLAVGDSIVAGPVSGKVRAMADDRARRLQAAGPSAPVQVIGLSDVPEASELFRVVSSDREARTLAEEQRAQRREVELASMGPRSMVEISQLFAAGEAKVLNLILKADAQGSAEAIADSLRQMETEEVQVNLLHTGVGEVTESDVSLAAASKPTVVIGFQVGADTQARRLAADEHIEIRRYEVIYDLLDDVRQTMIGMLEATHEEAVVGTVEVRALFRSSRFGTIAGCYVSEGRIFRGTSVRVLRGRALVYEGRLDSLRHLKDDVSEMTQGFECGLTVEGFQDFQVGDIIQCIEHREVRRLVL